MTMAADKQDKVLNFSSEREQSGACSCSAEREKNQGKNFLNVPNKREQSQTCLNSAERAGLRPKGNVPTLRFPEFRGEWNWTTFGECCSSLEYGMNAPAKEFDGKNKYIRITDIDEDTYTYKYDDIVSPNAVLEDKYRVKKNDILFARTGASTGKAYLYDEQDGLMYYAGFLIRGNVKPDNNSKFVFLQTQTTRYKKWVDIMSIRSGQPGINSQEYSGFKFNLPPSRAEQDRISTLFSLLDERISTQNRIIEKLKSLMQGLNNELMDNPKWAKVYVGDFMEFYSTNSLTWESLNYEKGQIMNLHYGLIHNGLPIIVDCHKKVLPYAPIDFSSNSFTLCHSGDIALADASEDTTEVGKAVELINCEDNDVLCGIDTIHGRDIKGYTTIGFKGFAFNAKYFHDQIRKLAQGSKIYHLHSDNVKSCYLYIPTVAEQQKIVGLLRCMQDKIEIAEYKLQLYKTQKQFFLRGLFV